MRNVDVRNTSNPASMQNTTSRAPQNAKSHGNPQPVTLVEIADEDLEVIQDTDPVGTMMMSAQMVEILGEEDDAVKRGRMNVCRNYLTLEDRTFLAAMAEKRGRMEQDANDNLAREGPKTQKPKLGEENFSGSSTLNQKQDSEKV
ncbi:hypothetical protein BGX38DRAFT_1274074 [Terfezia claveryi]|nr:hypothetical protein BGX38DRAFT_1274074 [Terfezia claveryi]